MPKRRCAARIDGSPAPVEYDEAREVNRILVPERGVERGVTVEAEVEDADTGKQPLSGQVYGPETESIDLERRYTLADGATIGWRSAAVRDDGAVDLRAAYDESYRLAYAFTVLEADREQEATFGVWSDDGVELWLNGRKVLSHDVSRSLGAAPDRLTGTLRQGANLLLLKVANGLADWAFRVELETRQPVFERER